MISLLGHRILPMFLAGLLLAACASPGAAPPTGLNQLSEKPLWKGAATGSQLIYVAVKATSMLVFSYPQGQMVDRIGGLHEANTICGDTSGDVFLSENNGIFKYAHGGTTPISEISESFGATTCAVDPTSGDLAVLAGDTFAVYVYPKQQAPPIIYTDSTSFLYTRSVTYDSNGNLFVSGISRGAKPTFMMA